MPIEREDPLLLELARRLDELEAKVARSRSSQPINLSIDADGRVLTARVRASGHVLGTNIPLLPNVGYPGFKVTWFPTAPGVLTLIIFSATGYCGVQAQAEFDGYANETGNTLSGFMGSSTLTPTVLVGTRLAINPLVFTYVPPSSALQFAFVNARQGSSAVMDSGDQCWYAILEFP